MYLSLFSLFTYFLRNALFTDESNVNTFDTNYFVIEILP